MRKTLALLAIAALSACAAANAGGPSLTDSQWRFVAIDGMPPAGDEANLAFQADRLNANAGCNRMAGPWRVESGKLIAGPLMATKMFCEGRMEQEAAVSTLLSGSPTLTVAGDRMTLKSEAHSAELVRAKQPG